MLAGALPVVSGIGRARFIVPVEMDDLPVITWLCNPACTQAFHVDRTAILQTPFFGLRFDAYVSGRTAILAFFSTRKLAELAKSLAQDVAKRYPPAIANDPAQIVSQQRLSGILEQVFTRAAKFSRENKLGWYKRAKLGRDFRWELTELGYGEKFVDTATESLILCVTRNPSPKT